MHGIFLKGLKEFVIEEYDRGTWDAVLDGADVDRTMYLAIETYDDEELDSLLRATVAETGEPADDLLESYGRSIGARLLATYGSVVDDGWTALDLIENVDRVVRPTLEAQNPKMDLPDLECRRVNVDTVNVHYRSSRQFCRVARGILVAVGEHYDERITVSETRCTHDGAEACEFSIRQ